MEEIKIIIFSLPFNFMLMPWKLMFCYNYVLVNILNGIKLAVASLFNATNPEIYKFVSVNQGNSKHIEILAGILCLLFAVLLFMCHVACCRGHKGPCRTTGLSSNGPLYTRKYSIRHTAAIYFSTGPRSNIFTS